MDTLDKQLEFYRQVQGDLSVKHHGKVVLICNTEIVDIYDSDDEAYIAATDKGLEPGSFLIRGCLRPDEEPTATYHTRASF